MAALSRTMDLVSGIPAGAPAETALAALFQVFDREFGAKALACSDYVRSNTPHILARQAPKAFYGSFAQVRSDNRSDLIAHARRTGRSFTWSEALPKSDRALGPIWESMSPIGVKEGLYVPRFRPGGITSVSVAFESLDVAPQERTAMHLACLYLAEQLAPAAAEAPAPKLSKRESECIGFVADGKTDWEISCILGIAQTTVHAHVETAKRKLGATTRAQAVAHFVRRYLA